MSSAIDAQRIVRNMFQCNAVTLKELQSIQSKHSKPVKAAEELLNIVMKQSGNVYSCFLDALKTTGHQDVYKIIVSGSYKGTHDIYVSLVLPLRRCSHFNDFCFILFLVLLLNIRPVLD